MRSAERSEIRWEGGIIKYLLSHVKENRLYPSDEELRKSLKHWEATIRMPALQKCHEGSSHFLSLHDKPLQNAVTKQ